MVTERGPEGRSDDDDLDAFRNKVRHFVAGELQPSLNSLGESRAFPRSIVATLGERGFFAECIRPGRAGSALSTVRPSRFAALVEELARTRCFGLTLVVSMQVGVFLGLIQRLLNDSLREKVLEPALRGHLIGTLAATEYTSAGSDFAGMETAAEFLADRIVLRGHKHYITSAVEADYAIVFARWREGRHFSNYCAILVPLNLPGVRRIPIDMAVMHNAAIGRIEFDDVELDPIYVLGRKSLGFQYFIQHIAVERLSGGIWAAAVAEQCLEETQGYCRQRMVGTESLWQRDSVRQRVGSAIVQTSLLRAIVNQTLSRFEATGNLDTFNSTVIKAAVAPMMEHVIGTCLQLRGARGLEASSPLLRLLNEFRAFGVAGGPTEVMLEILADLQPDDSNA